MVCCLAIHKSVECGAFPVSITRINIIHSVSALVEAVRNMRIISAHQPDLAQRSAISISVDTSSTALALSLSLSPPSLSPPLSLFLTHLGLLILQAPLIVHKLRFLQICNCVIHLLHFLAPFIPQQFPRFLVFGASLR